jgi:2-polyprenyl-3-methyl-5-hydroxy-6-metoxy-1,4-benzoquinol methylase
MFTTKLRYLLWASSNVLRERSCPACASKRFRVVYTKYVVTSLYECSDCYLRYRVPTHRGNARRFYEEEYEQGLTTACPTDEDLQRMLVTSFRGTEKDFGPYIEVLKATGLRDGATILDFGSSWGYGSWQFRQAGFSVYSYELSRPRSEYARQKLHCQTVNDWHELPGKVDCFFSAHVIEHLDNPNLLWDVAQECLKPGGVFVCFCPNGNPSLEGDRTTRPYHQLWGNVHPLLITPEFLLLKSREYRFAAELYSSPYNSSRIAAREAEPNPVGDELLLVGRPNAANGG